MRKGNEWYEGTADAVYQNLYLIDRHKPRNVAIFGSDHIYRMNIGQMFDEYRTKGVHVFVAALRVKLEEATQFGVIEIDPNWRIVGFQEKPAQPKQIPGDPDHALVSMGNYIFDTEVLAEALSRDAKNVASSHDFGQDILPRLIEDKKVKVYAYNFENNRVPLALEGEEPSYWRDVGTIDAYYNANMDLRAVSPSFNLYNWRWPIRTLGYGGPPPKFVFDEKEHRGVAINSIVAEGTSSVGAIFPDR
jgi:glucose-1-phosphate adenylyltransferase